MADGFLSQKETDELLNRSKEGLNENDDVFFFSKQDNDLLGEIGNISMGAASTALSKIISQSVNITTPVIDITTIEMLKQKLIGPNILLEVKYKSGIDGKNILITKMTDASIIANFMMGGDGSKSSSSLSEIEISAIQEAMNQMIGSSATSMATMLRREVNISPPTSRIWVKNDISKLNNLENKEKIVAISFNLNIGKFVDSTIMQVLPISTAREIVKIMMEQ